MTKYHSSQEKINKAIALMATDPDIQRQVKKIEFGIKTTKGNYGKYMSFLSNFKEKTARYIISQAMLKAGADQYGVALSMTLIEGQNQ